VTGSGDAGRNHLALVGGRGCGKTSTAARLAAEHPSFRLLDLDALTLEEGAANSVAQIVNDGGWRAWRELEYRVLERVTDSPPGALVDCGGGIVVDLDASDGEIFSDRKVAVLRRRCRVVYLRCDSELLWSRISDDSSRPALSPNQSFASLMEQREPWYDRAADRTIEADSLSPDELAREIAGWFFAETAKTPAGG
jgi:shikimate kinase